MDPSQIKSRPARRPSPAAVVATLALFAGLSGTAWALSKGEVRSAHIATNAVKSKHIKDGNLSGRDLRADSLTGREIDESALELQGAQGETGPIGPAGPQGPKGDTGSQGQPGQDGSPDTAQQVLDKLKTVDGPGSDLDADLLDGLQAAAFAPAGHDHDARYWALGGNAGTDPATDFLGTTDDQPLELRVDGARAFRLEPASNGTSPSPNLIGGSPDNSVGAGVHTATIAGGGRGVATDPASANRVTDDFGVIGGGSDNQVGDAAGTASDRPYSTVAGGSLNTASGIHATVGGGEANTASGLRTSVGGGGSNTASGQTSVVGGGGGNVASGSASTVPGGSFNTAQGPFSLAAGRQARANHDGTFVWGDSTAAEIASTGANQFIARAAGHFFLQGDSTLDDQGGFLNTSTGAFLSTGGTWTNASDRRLKQGFRTIEPGRVLARLASLPVGSWSYRAEPGVRHIGPTAQAFHRAFGVGADRRHIASVDADGVALAAIKGLNRKLETRNQRLRERLRRLGSRHGKRIAELEKRLAAIERRAR